MKTIILVALIAVLATAAPPPSPEVQEVPHESNEIEESIDDVRLPQTKNLGVALKGFYDSFRKMMPCGYPKKNIPVLAPLVLEHLPLNYSNEFLRVNGDLSELNIVGLNDFRFLKINFDEQTNELTTDFILNNLQVLGEYELDLWANLAGFPVTFNGKGLLDQKIVDLRAVGSVEFAQNGKGLKLQNMKIYFSLGDFIVNNWNSNWDISLNNYMNKFLSSHGLMVTQQIQGSLNDILEKYYVPYVNEMLQDMSLKELVKFYNDFAKELNSVKCHPEL